MRTTTNGHEVQVGEELIQGQRCYSGICWTCNYEHVVELLMGVDDQVNEPVRLMVQKLIREHCEAAL